MHGRQIRERADRARVKWRGARGKDCRMTICTRARRQAQKKPGSGHLLSAFAKPLLLRDKSDMRRGYPKACPQSLWVTLRVRHSLPPA